MALRRPCVARFVGRPGGDAHFGSLVALRGGFDLLGRLLRHDGLLERRALLQQEVLERRREAVQEGVTVPERIICAVRLAMRIRWSLAGYLADPSGLR